MTFVYIAPGTFTMGSHRGADQEKPVHQVAVGRGFYMQTTEVTVGQFRKFADKTGYRTTAERDKGTHVNIGGSWEKKDDACWRKPYFSQGDDHPVVCVSWDDAVEFAGWLSKSTGDHYRLPTEAEWEFACRAGSTERFSWGGRLDDSYCWYKDNSNGRPHDVGRKRPSAWGLHDMIGNAAEWCSDWYGEEYYSESPASDPAGPSSGIGRVGRGGSWLSDAGNLRASLRFGGKPEFSSPMLGFRLVMSAPSTAQETARDSDATGP
ncbi:MAG: formylglycine-generating enzyme family protein [bacterium]|nr:formylglycine-generating enzyme family protein [bacterium]